MCLSLQLEREEEGRSGAGQMPSTPEPGVAASLFRRQQSGHFPSAATGCGFPPSAPGSAPIGKEGGPSVSHRRLPRGPRAHHPTEVCPTGLSCLSESRGLDSQLLKGSDVVTQDVRFFSATQKPAGFPRAALRCGGICSHSPAVRGEKEESLRKGDVNPRCA